MKEVEKVKAKKPRTLTPEYTYEYDNRTVVQKAHDDASERIAEEIK